MADKRALPHIRQAFLDARGSVAQSWFAWLQRINDSLESGTLSGEANAQGVATIATKLGSPDGDPDTIPPQPGDVAINGNEGVNVTGTLASGGPVNITLANVDDSEVGAALVKITRDNKGRIEGTEAATTDDLTEGLNLYFTDARADARIAAFQAAPTLDPLPNAIDDAAAATAGVAIGALYRNGSALMIRVA